MTFHHVVQQRYRTDCGVATLAMLLSEYGRSYEDVLVAVIEEAPRAIHRGLFLPEMIRAAKRLGVTLRQRRSYNLEDATGILRVTWEDAKGAHVVFVREGQLTDTDGVVWEPDLYFAAKRAIPRALLVVA